jgi:hypothetical protein
MQHRYVTVDIVRLIERAERLVEEAVALKREVTKYAGLRSLGTSPVGNVQAEVVLGPHQES